MESLAIIVLYHGPISGQPTARHLAAIEAAAPDAVVVPLSFATVPNISLIRVPPEQADNEGRRQWYSADLLFWTWMLRNDPSCDRFLIVENDTLMTQHPRDFFGDSWNDDVVGSKIMLPGTEWGWWNVEPQVSAPIQDDQKWGISPIFTLLSGQAARVMNGVLWSNPWTRALYCEVRLGVLARMAGFTPKTFSPNAENFIRVGPVNPSGPGIWHKIVG